jgi:predicted GNAT family acetyltransferase
LHRPIETTALSGRFVHYFDDGSVAELIFTKNKDNIITINHVGVPPQHRSAGLAAKLVKTSVEHFRADGVKVIPKCRYAAAQFRRHPEWSDLLAEAA